MAVSAGYKDKVNVGLNLDSHDIMFKNHWTRWCYCEWKVFVICKYIRCSFDTWSSTTLLQFSFVSKCEDTYVINAFDIQEVECKGNNTFKIWIAKRGWTLLAVVSGDTIDGVKVIMGM